MMHVYMNDEGKFSYPHNVEYKIDVVDRRNPATGEHTKYIALFKNGVEDQLAGKEELNSIEPKTISEFIDFLKEAVNDKFFGGKLDVTIPLEVYKTLFLKWK